MSRSVIFGALAALIGATSASAQVIYTETFDDGAAATRWSAPINVQEDNTLPPDFTVNYAYNYGALLNPFSTPTPGSAVGPAPNTVGGTTTGIYFTSNKVDNTTGDEGEAVGAVSNFNLPTGTPFTVQVDMFLYWNSGGGSTEYGTFGINHQRSPNVPLRFGLNNGDGLAYSVTTDGDTAADVIRFTGTGQTPIWDHTAPGSLSTPTIPAGSIPGVTTGAGTNPQGPYSQWVTLTMTYTPVNGGFSTFAMNGFVLNGFANPGVGGGILLGHADPFNSVNGILGAGLEAFGVNAAIFDNVIVTVPEPSSAALLALGCVAAGIRRRTA